MGSMSRKEFLKQYVFEVDVEFTLDGREAAWSPTSGGGPQRWGDEDSSLPLIDTDLGTGRRPDSAAFALSPDGMLLAVATNKLIRIYTSWDKHLKEKLVGHLENVKTVFFAPKQGECPDDAKYMLLSEAENYSDEEHNPIMMWYLNAVGRSTTKTMPFAIESLADRAIGAIEMDLTSHHELSASSIGQIRSSLVESLTVADIKNRAADQTTLPGGFPKFGSKNISSDAKNFLHLEHNKSTKRGMRPPNELPQVIVRSFADPQTEIVRLRGHEDAIMWASFSPTNANIFATAAWDKTYQIWNLEHKKSSSVIGPTVGQNWSGDFSPDGQFILLSGTNNVAIYKVATGEQVSKLERPNLAAWVRYLEWSPAGDAIALCSDIEVLLWEPFKNDEEKRKLGTAIVKLTKPDNPRFRSFMVFIKAKWLDRKGERLAVMSGDGTVMIWDRKENWKWRFQRPKGQPLDLSTTNIAYVDETEMVYILHGDRKLRMWRLS